MNGDLQAIQDANRRIAELEAEVQRIELGQYDLQDICAALQRERDEACAALVAEREPCARIVEETPFTEGTHTGARQLDLKRRAAAAIRARSTIAKATGKP